MGGKAHTASQQPKRVATFPTVATSPHAATRRLPLPLPACRPNQVIVYLESSSFFSLESQIISVKPHL